MTQQSSTDATFASPHEWLDLAGRMDGKVHGLPVRVYYEDTDFSGVVYHASYLRFLERGRSDFLRLSGTSHAELAKRDLAFAVRRMTLDFARPARIDDLLVVTTRAVKLGGASLHLTQAVTREGQILVSAEVAVALVTAEGRPARLDGALRDRLSVLLHPRKTSDPKRTRPGT